MTGKHIIAWVAVATIAIGLGACAARPQSASQSPPQWRDGMAIQLYSFHRDLERDLPGTLRRIKALGFDRVETYPIANVSAVQLRAALDAAGLDAVSAHMPWDRIKSDITGVIADARVLGAGRSASEASTCLTASPLAG